MSSFGSDSDSGDEIRVVWRSGPPQKVAPRSESSTSSYHLPSDATPDSKSKRSTKSAGLRSPSAAGSSGEPPQRDSKKKKKKIKKPSRDSAGVVRSDVPMDQTTLRLVSQLAMKVQARCQPVHIPSTHCVTRIGDNAVTHDKAGSGSTHRSHPAKGSPLLPKTNHTRASLNPAPQPRKLGFAATKPSLSAIDVKLPTQTSVSGSCNPPRQTTTDTTVDAEEEEDFDSYFDDFGDASFELALSQLDTFESARGDRAPTVIQADATETSQEADGKRRRTEELARRELESLAQLTDWGSDDDF